MVRIFWFNFFLALALSLSLKLSLKSHQMTSFFVKSDEVSIKKGILHQSLSSKKKWYDLRARSRKPNNQKIRAYEIAQLSMKNMIMAKLLFPS